MVPADGRLLYSKREEVFDLCIPCDFFITRSPQALHSFVPQRHFGVDEVPQTVHTRVVSSEIELTRCLRCFATFLATPAFDWDWDSPDSS